MHWLVRAASCRISTCSCPVDIIVMNGVALRLAFVSIRLQVRVRILYLSKVCRLEILCQRWALQAYPVYVASLVQLQ
eukprot:675293-Rhodomonas_salina.1